MIPKGTLRCRIWHQRPRGSQGASGLSGADARRCQWWAQGVDDVSGAKTGTPSEVCLVGRSPAQPRGSGQSWKRPPAQPKCSQLLTVVRAARWNLIRSWVEHVRGYDVKDQPRFPLPKSFPPVPSLSLTPYERVVIDVTPVKLLEVPSIRSPLSLNQRTYIDQGPHKPSKTWFSLGKNMVFVCENLYFSIFFMVLRAPGTYIRAFNKESRTLRVPKFPTRP